MTNYQKIPTTIDKIDNELSTREDKYGYDGKKKVIHFVVFDQSKSMDRSFIYHTKKEYVLKLIELYTSFFIDDNKYHHEFHYFGFSKNLNKRTYDTLDQLKFDGDLSYIIQNVYNAALSLHKNYKDEYAKYLIIITDGKDNNETTTTEEKKSNVREMKKECNDITAIMWIGVHKDLTKWTSYAGTYSHQVDGENIDAKLSSVDIFLHQTVFVNTEYTIAEYDFWKKKQN